MEEVQALLDQIAAIEALPPEQRPEGSEELLQQKEALETQLAELQTRQGELETQLSELQT